MSRAFLLSLLGDETKVKTRKVTAVSITSVGMEWRGAEAIAADVNFFRNHRGWRQVSHGCEQWLCVVVFVLKDVPNVAL